MNEKASTEKKEKKKIVGFQVLEDECIWMKAGVVNFRLCDNAYDCFTCGFDKGMRRAMGVKAPPGEKEGEPGWMTYLRRAPGAERHCRHFLTGRIENPKICPMNYECYHCPYDQMLDEVDLGEPTGHPAYMRASGYRMADGYYYHLGHSWARIEHGGRVRVGFDDFLVKVFGPAQGLTLPSLGATLKQGKVGLTLARDDHKAAVLAPVTGTVLAVNHKAMEHPDIAYEDPYQEGWLFIVEPGILKANLKGLYYGNESFQWIEKENQRLMKLLGPEYEQLAATGGEPVGDIFGHFPEIGWDRLTETFLRTEKI